MVSWKYAENGYRCRLLVLYDSADDRVEVD